MVIVYVYHGATSGSFGGGALLSGRVGCLLVGVIGIEVTAGLAWIC